MHNITVHLAVCTLFVFQSLPGESQEDGVALQQMLVRADKTLISHIKVKELPFSARSHSLKS